MLRKLFMVVFAIIVAATVTESVAQVNAVQFGRNRLQYKKFKYKFYQSPNFNTYVTDGGTELGKFASQLAEAELPQIEKQIEYSLQRRIDLVVYNNYDEYKQSNIGLGIDWQNPGGITKLVNNKLIVYFDGNHNNLRLQIREGIARVLVENLLFGDNIGEIASNQALLDLPKWITDGYVQYIAQPWSTQLDDQLKSAILGGSYNNFYQFVFHKPNLAGHAFWYYIADKYKPESVSYFLYLARIYKSLNSASLKVCRKKFKEVLDEFMEFQENKYNNDIRQRRNAPKGTLSVTEDITESDFFRFQANPNPRNNNYAVVEFYKGIYTAKLVENFYETTTLLKQGVKTRQGDINPNLPILAWDPKGTRVLVIYWEKGKTRMFVYDVVGKYRRNKQVLDQFEQVLDASFMLDANTIVLSAVKNGHSDIFIYKIEEQKLTQITNDVYDDLNPTFVSFPNRSGIIFSSNRPGNNAPNADTVLPSNYRFNIYLVDIFNNTATKQVSQLTNLKVGDAKYPMQYNTNHFTFVSDANGIANRWAGFFSTKRDGLDTLYYIGDELLRNPSPKELDSTMVAWQKNEPDSVSYFQVFQDSTYTFPITNYQSSLLETRVAGNNGQVSEVRLEGDYKYLYKLRVNDDALNRRNINLKPTAYMKKLLDQKKAEDGNPTIKGDIKMPVSEGAKTTNDEFQSEFEGEVQDSSTIEKLKSLKIQPQKSNPLDKIKLHNYKMNFGADYFQSGITNTILINRYQPYAGGQGPIFLNNGSDFNWSFRVGTSDLFEDIKFIGGVRFAPNLSDKDVFMTFQNNKRMIDWGLTYFRSNTSNYKGFFKGNFLGIDLNAFDNKFITNIYQLNVTLPFNEVKSLRGTFALRTDRGIIKPVTSQFLVPDAVKLPDSIASTIMSRIEYVHDNTLNPAQNIWKGLRYKVFLDVNLPTNMAGEGSKLTYNFGFDVRNYHTIYRNFIWATRIAADFSWGNQKILYYLGGVDGWIGPRFNANQPANDQTYGFQSLALNMRGFNQNIANGNNAFVFNSELRLPIFSTIFNKPVNNAFLRNLQLVQFIDLGSAWNGKYNGIKRPSEVYIDRDNLNNPVTVRVDAGGLGPLAGGYGFGVRSTLLGYFVKGDLAWPMKGIFKGSPLFYFSLGFDF